MNQTAKKLSGSARERIVEVASDLFYKQGYRATGINEVIEKSGVAKATFYSHFPSKDDLCQVCLGNLSNSEFRFVEDAIRQANNPLQRFYAVIESLKPWALDTEFRGCAFMNIASEIPDSNSPLRSVGKKLYDQIAQRVTELTNELVEADAARYARLDVQQVSAEYMLIFSGAVALAELYHAIWPIEQAITAIQGLLEAKVG